MRPGIVLAASVGLVGALATAAAWGSGDAVPAPTQAPPAAATAQVQRGTLADREQFDATLGYADLRGVTNHLAGTVTQLRPDGSRVRPGAVLYRVDGRPVVHMAGTMPAYRSMGPGVSTGRDIKQIEANLRDLGHDPGGTMGVDGRWTPVTTAAVKRWQRDLGVPQTGTIELGTVVFQPGTRRISAHTTDVGGTAAPGDDFLTMSSWTREATFSIDARRTDLVAPDTPVQVSFPDGTTGTGTISAVSRTATRADEQSAPKVSVSVAVTEPPDGALFDQSPVGVAVEREARSDVLIVPVTALTALAGGKYAVEVVQGAGTRLVPVELGLLVDGQAEVSGSGLDAGMTVVVAP